MSKPSDRRPRRTSDQRKQPDLRRLSRALIELAQAQAEVDAETAHRSGSQPRRRQRGQP
jgi:hypothetical protein